MAKWSNYPLVHPTVVGSLYLEKSFRITKPCLLPPMLVYVIGPNRSIYNNSNSLLMLIILSWDEYFWLAS
jgi:hypothetical protein